MSDTPNIDRLLEMSTRLTALLKDPHPGLFTWREAYARVTGQIAAFLGERKT